MPRQVESPKKVREYKEDFQDVLLGSENVDPNVGGVGGGRDDDDVKRDSTVKVRIESVAGLIYQGSGSDLTIYAVYQWDGDGKGVATRNGRVTSTGYCNLADERDFKAPSSGSYWERKTEEGLVVKIFERGQWGEEGEVVSGPFGVVGGKTAADVCIGTCRVPLDVLNVRGQGILDGWYHVEDGERGGRVGQVRVKVDVVGKGGWSVEEMIEGRKFESGGGWVDGGGGDGGDERGDERSVGRGESQFRRRVRGPSA